MHNIKTPLISNYRPCCIYLWQATSFWCLLLFIQVRMYSMIWKVIDVHWYWKWETLYNWLSQTNTYAQNTEPFHLQKSLTYKVLRYWGLSCHCHRYLAERFGWNCLRGGAVSFLESLWCHDVVPNGWLYLSLGLARFKMILSSRCRVEPFQPKEFWQ